MANFFKRLFGKDEPEKKQMPDRTEFTLSLNSRFIKGELKTVYMEDMAELNKNFDEVLPDNYVLVKEPEEDHSTRQWEWRIGRETLYCDIHTSMLDAPGKEPGMRIWVFNYNIIVWYYKKIGNKDQLEGISKSIIAMLKEKYGIRGNG